MNEIIKENNEYDKKNEYLIQEKKELDKLQLEAELNKNSLTLEIKDETIYPKNLKQIDKSLIDKIDKFWDILDYFSKVEVYKADWWYLIKYNNDFYKINEIDFYYAISKIEQKIGKKIIIKSNNNFKNDIKKLEELDSKTLFFTILSDKTKYEEYKKINKNYKEFIIDWFKKYVFNTQQFLHNLRSYYFMPLNRIIIDNDTLKKIESLAKNDVEKEKYIKIYVATILTLSWFLWNNDLTNVDYIIKDSFWKDNIVYFLKELEIYFTTLEDYNKILSKNPKDQDEIFKKYWLYWLLESQWYWLDSFHKWLINLWIVLVFLYGIYRFFKIEKIPTIFKIWSLFAIPVAVNMATWWKHNIFSLINAILYWWLDNIDFKDLDTIKISDKTTEKKIDKNKDKEINIIYKKVFSKITIKDFIDCYENKKCENYNKIVKDNLDENISEDTKKLILDNKQWIKQIIEKIIQDNLDDDIEASFKNKINNIRSFLIFLKTLEKDKSLEYWLDKYIKLINTVKQIK